VKCWSWHAVRSLGLSEEDGRMRRMRRMGRMRRMRRVLGSWNGEEWRRLEKKNPCG